jgi:pSer/pThr/pTyr-binding forkhead associated (FHA) protein
VKGVHQILLSEGTTTIGRAPESDICLADDHVSRHHARIQVRARHVTVEDLETKNGTLVNGERVHQADVGVGDTVDIGRYTFSIGSTDDQFSTAPQVTSVLEPATEPELGPIELISDQQPGVVPAEWLAQPILSEAALRAAGVEVKTAEYAALGAGLGSFMWVDLLRNSGAHLADVVVVGPEERPYARYARLCSNSQIPLYERLRSHSESCPDNLWGFPSYATRECWREASQGHLRSAASLLWSIFGEPALARTYTPRSGDVFRGLDREAERIGWHQMWRRGRVRAIRKSEEGHLLAVVSETDARRRKHVVIASRFLHIALGYPAIQLLPDLAAYREAYHDEQQVVNAYEAHDHVYEQLRRGGGTVLLRGRGIVASRILQRLYEERRYNTNISVVHLHRSRMSEGHRYGLSRRVVEAQWEFQPFNWPKSAWGGEQLEKLLHATGAERKRLIDQWGGTTTANRRDWRRMVREGSRDGWYRTEFGRVEGVRPAPQGGVMTQISSGLIGGGTLELHADFVIDCTGAVHDPMRSTIFADMVRMYDLPLNALAHLQVNSAFEIEGLRHAGSRAYAAGVLTLGGPHAAVDSFLGLQYAALRAVDAMVAARVPGLRHLNAGYSIAQWLKWVRGVEP